MKTATEFLRKSPRRKSSGRWFDSQKWSKIDQFIRAYVRAVVDAHSSCSSDEARRTSGVADTGAISTGPGKRDIAAVLGLDVQKVFPISRPVPPFPTRFSKRLH